MTRNPKSTGQPAEPVHEAGEKQALEHRYAAIGIPAVAAACRYAGRHEPPQTSESEPEPSRKLYDAA